MVKGDVRRMRLATLFQMTFPGAPSVYYGDEIGMEGGRDPDCRRAFPWNEWCWDTALLADVRRAIALRRAYPALRRGTLILLAVTEDAYAFARCHEGDVVVVALNRGNTPAHLSLNVSALVPSEVRFEDVWCEGVATVAAGILEITVPPLEGRVYVA
jgi:neopullulanase